MPDSRPHQPHRLMARAFQFLLAFGRREEKAEGASAVSTSALGVSAV